MIEDMPGEDMSENQDEGLVEDIDVSILPLDWNQQDYWQDNTYCTQDTDDFLVFESTENIWDALATREGCNKWCTL